MIFERLSVIAPIKFWQPYRLSLIPTGFAMLMGAAGLFGWNIYPETI